VGRRHAPVARRRYRLHVGVGAAVVDRADQAVGEYDLVVLEMTPERALACAEDLLRAARGGLADRSGGTLVRLRTKGLLVAEEATAPPVARRAR
jgi:hypothetical protein